MDNGNSNHDSPENHDFYDEVKALTTSRRAGRKSKCTIEMIEIIARAIAEGLSTKDTCALVEIDPTTFYRWFNDGEEEIKRLDALPHDWDENDINPHLVNYVLFNNAVKKAIPMRKLALINKIRLADEWQSKAWLLERLHPEEFGKRTVVKIETWQTELIELVKDNVISYEQLTDELGEHDARELFKRAGKRIPETV